MSEQKSGTSKLPRPSNSNVDRLATFAAAALQGLTANRMMDAQEAARRAADAAIALNTELQKRGL